MTTKAEAKAALDRGEISESLYKVMVAGIEKKTESKSKTVRTEIHTP